MGERVVGIGGIFFKARPRAPRGLVPRPPARFDAFPPSVRRGILQWIASAKKPETRARRVEETARLAARNVRANQWRPSS